MKTKLLIGAGLLCMTVHAAKLPDLVLPNGVGVNIHFTRGHERDLDMIAAAGVKVARMDMGWAGVERKQGEYNWSALDELTANLEKRGIQPYYILDYSNPLYEEIVTSKNPVTGQEHKDVASPQKSESVDAFARWAAAAAKHFQGRHVIWEIWNEPNISFWKPKPDVQQYTALTLAACKAVREADSSATIVAPATSGIPLNFLEEFFKSDVLEQLDAVSVHPYRNYKNPPETVVEEYRKLRELIARHAPSAKKQMPILSGEWGYATHTKGISTDTQANFLVRQQLVNVLLGVPVSIWYDWKNDGTDAAEREHNFGTVTHDLEPKPAYVALQTMTRELGGYRIARRLDTGSDQDYVLLLANIAGRQKLAAWTTADRHTISLRVELVTGGKISGTDRSGTVITPKLEGDQLVLELSAAPEYVALEGARLK